MITDNADIVDWLWLTDRVLQLSTYLCKLFCSSGESVSVPVYYNISSLDYLSYKAY